MKSGRGLRCARRLVDRDHVARRALLLGQRVDHLLAEIVHRLHLGRLQRQLARLAGARGGACGRAVDLDLDHLALDNLRLLLDAHADRPAERLRERLSLVHLQRKDLGRGNGGEGRVGAERLRHAHGDGGLARTRLARDQDRAARDPTVTDHLQDHAGCLARVRLPDHTLRDGARLERVVEAETANVRVRTDALDAGDVLHLLHLHRARVRRHGSRVLSFLRRDARVPLVVVLPSDRRAQLRRLTARGKARG